MEGTTLEWFGATTFRLRSRGITIFLDTWLERPSVMPKYLSIDEVIEADYIFISHAHFDHLPGADRIAIKTGATVIANCEAINCLRNAGVPEDQLLPVAGGERIPLFTREIWDKARQGEIPTAPGPPGGVVFPEHSFAAFSVHVWPSLHCLMPQGHPEVIDTGEVYTGEAHPYVCTLDITFGMKHGLLKIGEHMPPEKMNDGIRSFAKYVGDRTRNVFSHCDGGQLMFNFIFDGKALLWSAHLGAYEGIMRDMQPKPDIAILGIAGRANLNGRPFDGSAAEFALKEVGWLGEPGNIIWCLHDESCIPPYRIDTAAATGLVEKETRSRVMTLEHAKFITLDI
ncbi:Metallo-hydrolase/oxidoreductase [Thozetella sp. PMI_491]|nr:Metallo-hydrolase/oxidoreductase [Thozetella sp. PMI_491]